MDVSHSISTQMTLGRKKFQIPGPWGMKLTSVDFSVSIDTVRQSTFPCLSSKVLLSSGIAAVYSAQSKFNRYLLLLSKISVNIVLVNWWPLLKAFSFHASHVTLKKKKTTSYSHQELDVLCTCIKIIRKKVPIFIFSVFMASSNP